MKTVHDARFQAERRQFTLLHTCEDCVHLDPGSGCCVHGYPNEVHRRAAFAPAPATNGTFCKEFELA